VKNNRFLSFPLVTFRVSERTIGQGKEIEKYHIKSSKACSRNKNDERTNNVKESTIQNVSSTLFSFHHYLIYTYQPSNFPALMFVPFPNHQQNYPHSQNEESLSSYYCPCTRYLCPPPRSHGRESWVAKVIQIQIIRIIQNIRIRIQINSKCN
jgi:hypothetical protein